MSIRNIVLSLGLCCVLLLSFSGMCYATPMYQMTPQELQTLEQDLATLQLNNQRLTQDYNASTVELQSAQDKLKLSEDTLAQLGQTLVQLRIDLELTKAHSQAAQKSLAETSASFETYVREEQSKVNSLKLQRDLGYLGILGVLLIKH